MEKISFTLFLILLGFNLNTSWARDDVGSYSVKEALDLEQSKSKLGNEVKFYFGSQKHGKVAKNFGEVGTSRKTNAFNKTDKEACQWTFLSAMIALKNRALRDGGNAVINIKSNYKNNLTESDSEFKCGAGRIIAGVALKGTIVKLQ